MRAKPAVLLIAALLTAVLAAGGCSGGGASSAGDEYGEQDGLEVGATAPDFRLKNQEQSTVALSDYKGVKNVVLIFYPADFTPV
jgi:cytochrome oxidase Cu insertion factor (SCO1/SenC/PrrC family)